MSLTQFKAHLHSHAALMSAILEQSGHVCEYLETIPFGECSKYMLYTFSNNTDPIVMNAITNSSKVHMEMLSKNGNPCLTDHSWVKRVHKNTLIQEIKNANDAWSSWEPEHEIGVMLKKSFDDIF